MQQPPQLQKRRHSPTRVCQKLPAADAAEAQGTEPCLIRDSQKVIALHQGAHSPAFALCCPPLGTLHEAPSPCVGCGIAERGMDRLTGGRREGSPGQRQIRGEREAVFITQPLIRILEQDDLLATGGIAPRPSDLPGLALDG